MSNCSRPLPVAEHPMEHRPRSTRGICQPRSVEAVVRLKSSFHWKPSTCMGFLSLLLARNPFLSLSPCRPRPDAPCLSPSLGHSPSPPPLPPSDILSPAPWKGYQIQGYRTAIKKSFAGHFGNSRAPFATVGAAGRGQRVKEKKWGARSRG